MIILIILAAISISALTKGNFIGLATKAAQNYADAQEYEGGMMENYKILLDAVVGNLTGSMPSTGGIAVTAKDLKAQNYGEYVDYGIDINNNGKADDWKIFYVGGDEDGEANGRIFLIAADYVPSNCSALTSALSSSGMTQYERDTNYETYHWKRGEEPDYHCNDGHNTSLNQTNEDGTPKAQCSFPELFMSTMYYCSSHVGTDGKTGNANAKCASSLQCTGNWKPFVDNSPNSKYADYAIGGPTLEMWVKSWNAKHGESSSDTQKQQVYIKGEESTSSVCGYCIGTEINLAEEGFAVLSSCEGYGDTLYFPHQVSQNLELDGTNDYNETCYGYWIASPSSSSTDNLCAVANAGYVMDAEMFGGDHLRCASTCLS